LRRHVSFFLFVVLLVSSCSQTQAQPPTDSDLEVTTPVEATASAPIEEQTELSIWESLLLRQPLDINGDPIALGEPGPLDGIYGRLDDSPPQWWRCLRCAEYRPAGGWWRMQLDRGVMRLLYTLNDWRTVAQYRIQDDKLILYNDLVCREEGEYAFNFEEGVLLLAVINDPCAFELRGRNLSTGSWHLCPQDRNAEGAPLGCGELPTFESFIESDPELTVTVHQGNARSFDSPPTVYTPANTEDRLPPEGVEIEFHPASMNYGVNRVLWWGGDWIEARTSLPFEAMGVQFYGTSTIGWASLFFDGVEVWRGNVSEIWNHFGSHGGYIEVSGYQPGEHVLRVELVEGDYRPLTIAVFGFSEGTGVSP
jgi:hypothetical protein